jgi:hypothetical protein
LFDGLTASAQPSALKELYGKGVHAYHAGQYDEADGLLTDAIDAGSKDPRCRYFRGLARLRIGDEELANEDFAAGAKLEVADTDRFYAVSKSLARTQGVERVTLERHRTNARLAAYKRSQELRLRKMRGIQDAASQVELQPVPGGARTAPAPAAEPQDDAAAEPDPMEEMKDENEPAESEDAAETKEAESDNADTKEDDAADGEKEEETAAEDDDPANKEDEDEAAAEDEDSKTKSE